AWKDLRRGRVGMDVPVALGMCAAFGASAWNAATGQGPIYFDSVAMFAFLLLGARYLELAGRARAAGAVEALAQATPALARRVRPGGTTERVAVAGLVAGDRVLVPPGEAIPADGTVIDGRSSVDESLLTGESRPVPKAPGAPLLG